MGSVRMTVEDKLLTLYTNIKKEVERSPNLDLEEAHLEEGEMRVTVAYEYRPPIYDRLSTEAQRRIGERKPFIVKSTLTVGQGELEEESALSCEFVLPQAIARTLSHRIFERVDKRLEEDLEEIQEKEEQDGS